VKRPARRTNAEKDRLMETEEHTAEPETGVQAVPEAVEEAVA